MGEKMKMIYNSISLLPQVGDRISLSGWSNTFYTVSKITVCISNCSACDNHLRVIFEGYPDANYCIANKWVYEREEVKNGRNEPSDRN